MGVPFWIDPYRPPPTRIAMAEASSPLIPIEARVLFLSAAGSWADDPIREALGRPLRWSLLLDLARREGGTSVLLRRLRQLRVPLPVDPLGTLEQLAAIQDFRMILLEDRLEVLLRRLAEQEIPVILLKGAAVALGAFGSFRDRPMSDVDLLLPEGEAQRVLDLALTLDWVRPSHGLGPEAYRDLHHLLPLDAAGGLGFGLEIHRAPFPKWNPFPFGATDLWREAQPFARPGGPRGAFVPSLHHQVLHTALHFAWSHSFARGAWRLVRDLDVLLSDPAFNPVEFGLLAREARGSSCVHWTLELMEALTGRPADPTLREALGDPVPNTFRGLLRRYLVSEAIGTRAVPGTRRFRRGLWTLAIRPRRSGHGRGRPWSGDERWPTSENPVAPGEGAPSDLTSRLRGFSRYASSLVFRGGRGSLQRQETRATLDQY